MEIRIICIIFDLLNNLKYKIMETLVGKRIKMIKMDDIDPIPYGTMGTIVHIGGGVINVKWDNGRTLGVMENEDQYEIDFV